MMVAVLALAIVATNIAPKALAQTPVTPSGSAPTTSWSQKCTTSVVDVTAEGLLNIVTDSAGKKSYVPLTKQNLTVPNDALWSTVQLGGEGYLVSGPPAPPASATLNFADGSSATATTPKVIKKSPAEITPLGKMFYTFEFAGKPGTLSVNPPVATNTKPETIVAYYAKPTQALYSSVGTTALKYVWGGDNGTGAFGPATQALMLPEALKAATDITVKVAVMEKDQQGVLYSNDHRINFVEAEAGGVTATQKLLNPDPNKYLINIVELTLKGVPAGTTTVNVKALSPLTPAGKSQWGNKDAGDSIVLLGATASHECKTQIKVCEGTSNKVDVKAAGLKAVRSPSKGSNDLIATADGATVNIPAGSTDVLLQVGGAGFRKAVAQSATFTFADNSQVTQAPQTVLKATSTDISKISPPDMMAYLIETTGKAGSNKAKVTEGNATDITAEGLVGYYHEPSSVPFNNAIGTKFQYVWGGDVGRYAIGSAKLNLTLAEALLAPADITVKAVLLEKTRKAFGWML